MPSRLITASPSHQLDCPPPALICLQPEEGGEGKAGLFSFLSSFAFPSFMLPFLPELAQEREIVIMLLSNSIIGCLLFQNLAYSLLKICGALQMAVLSTSYRDTYDVLSMSLADIDPRCLDLQESASYRTTLCQIQSPSFQPS